MPVVKQNPRVKALMMAALERERMKIVDLVRATNIDRGVVGAYVRGQRKLYNPEEVNVICKRAGVRVERFLEAAGFDVALTPSAEVDPELVDLWPELNPQAREVILSLAQEAAKAFRLVQGLGA
jgi:hypothetical protein